MRTSDPAKARRIIDAAADLFAERHYHEVRMDDIAARAGVAKGTLYLHFKDKEALYLGLILDGMERLQAEMEAAKADVRDPAARILAGVRVAVRFLDRRGYVLELAQRAMAMRNVPDAGPLDQCHGRFLEMSMRDFRALPGGADLPEPHLRLAALALGGMIREVLTKLPRPWAPDLAETLTGFLLRGVVAPVQASKLPGQDSNLEKQDQNLL